MNAIKHPVNSDQADEEKARRSVWESGDWLTAEQIITLAEMSDYPLRVQPDVWKKKGIIFAIQRGGTEYFPGYGLDHADGFRPMLALTMVTKILAPHRDCWGMAVWFGTRNPLLDGLCPQDLLELEPNNVIAAALALANAKNPA